MLKVTVYRFQMWDVINDTYRQSERWATKEAIDRIGAEPLHGSRVEIDDRYLGSEVQGMTKCGFDPLDPGPLPPLDPDVVRLGAMRKAVAPKPIMSFVLSPAASVG